MHEPNRETDGTTKKPVIVTGQESMMHILPFPLPFRSKISLPGSKSLANRAIIAACCTPGTTVIQNATLCSDVRLMIESVKQMGFLVSIDDESLGTITIVGGLPKEPREAELFCGNAGTTVRFLSSLACLVPGQWVITGDERMRTRPMKHLVEALRSLGADIEATGDCPPLRIRGGSMRGGLVSLDASVSSQYLSSLLLVGASLPEGLTVALTSSIASPSYVELTIAVLRSFGITVERGSASQFHVPHQPFRSPQTYAVEGDWSAAGAFLVLSALTGGSIDYTNLNPHSTQGDRALVDALKLLSSPGDFHLDCTDVPDQVMNLAVFAAFRTGTTTITGAKNLRVKECDRLAVLTHELSSIGVAITQHEDGVVVRGGSPLKAGITLDPHDDHRMAMAFAVLGMLGRGVSITNPSCVAKSYPSFFRDLMTVRRSGIPIVIIGMRGAGKSNLGRKLASALGLSFLDLDREIERESGMPIPEFVRINGWDAFRTNEEQAATRCLHSGHVVALGGGAIESAITRQRLTECIVIWMQMSAQGTVRRLTLTKRPPLTNLPLQDEVTQVLARRDPLYRACADVILPERVSFQRQIPFILAALRKRF